MRRAYKRLCWIKLYIFITEDNHESKKEKGSNKNVVDDELKNKDYKNILFNRSGRAVKCSSCSFCEQRVKLCTVFL